MRVALLVSLITLAACSRRTPTVRPDPVVVVEPSPPVVEPVTRVFRQGRIFDVRAGKVVDVLSKTLPRAEAGSDRHAVFLGDDDALHAHELATGHELWTAKPPWLPERIALGPKHAYAIRGAQVSATALASGASTTVTRPRSIVEAAAVPGGLVVQRDDHVIELLDDTTFAVVLAAKRTGRARLQVLPDAKTFCAAGDAAGALELDCWGVDGTPRAHARVDLHRPTDPAHPSFSIRQVTDRHVLYGTHFFGSGVRRAAVVRLSDGAVVARAEDEVATLVEDETGALAAMIVVRPEIRWLEPTGVVRWTAKAPTGDESAAAVARGGRLFLSTYCAGSSGSALLALDATNGKHLWTAEVEQLPIAHSAYFNETTLSWAFGHLVLRGDEAMVRTFQIFRATDGARLVSDSHHAR